LLIKLSQDTSLFGGVANKFDFYSLLKKDIVVFNTFDLYRDNLLINDGVKFDSGNNVFWQLECADTIKVTTRRQKVLNYDYQTVIIKSAVSLSEFKLLRRTKNLWYYIIFVDISILLPSNYTLRIDGKEVMVFTQDSCITLRSTDLNFNVMKELPPFIRAPKSLLKLSNLFHERAFGLMSYKNLEFFSHQRGDREIMDRYQRQRVTDTLR
jgi:hypothetical protein